MSAVRLAAALIACALLAACAGGGTRESDPTGSASTGEFDSPGDLYVAMAAEYYRQGQLEVALKRAETGLAADPKNARAHYMLGLLYQRIGENARAEKHFSEALRLEPKNSDIQNALGTFYCSQKRYSDADKQFAAALKNPLYSTPWVALTNAGICARQAGNTAKAEGYLRRAIDANPRFTPALHEMAEIAYRRGDYKAARGYLNSYFQSGQPTSKTLLLAAQVERKLGSRKRASTYETMLRKNFPGSAEAMSL